jgi:hypothetical protein
VADRRSIEGVVETMTESEFTRKLLRALRSHAALKDTVIWKISDRFSSGIPDLCITNGKLTNFFELKVHPNRSTKLQEYYLRRLREAGHLVTVEKKLLWAQIDEEYAGLAAEKDQVFDWLVLKIVTLCVNL